MDIRETLMSSLKVIAIIGIRNAECYLANALRHFSDNDVKFFIVDNSSEDNSKDIYLNPEFASHSLGFMNTPFLGHFSLRQQLGIKMNVIRRMDTDWVIHADADEIMHSYLPGQSLNDAIAQADSDGYNALDFDEFVFLPVQQNYMVDVRRAQPILSYYFFQPYAPRLMRAWKKSACLSNCDSGGHILTGENINLCPGKLALRHYIFMNQDHAYTKYRERRFAPDELALGMHNDRIAQPVDRFTFPPSEKLDWLADGESRSLDTSQPRKKHYWQWS
jgi:hypothetical protein